MSGHLPENPVVTGEGVIQINANTERKSFFQNRANAETIRSTEMP